MDYRRSIVTIIFIVYQIHTFSVGGCLGIFHKTQSDPPVQSQPGDPPPVRLQVNLKNVVLDNGILQVTFTKPEGYVAGIRYGGLDNVLDTSHKPSHRGYWDIASSTKLDGDGSLEVRLQGTWFNIIRSTSEKVEISFVVPPTKSVPLHVDNRYVMLRGSSGFYSYAIFERKKGLPSLEIDQIRAVYKLDIDQFRYMAISDRIQRVMPMPQDRESGRPLAYKEAVLLTNPTNNKLKGEWHTEWDTKVGQRILTVVLQVDDKYQYSTENKDNKLHGWISSDPPVGVWVITPSDEFRMGGPHKQDLTSHVGPNLLAMFHSTHYAGKNLSMSFKDGEPWKKVFGPYFVHLNSVHDKRDSHKLWENAKNQMFNEVKKWPYNFPMSPEFPKAKDRGSVLGRLVVHDLVVGPAAFAWVGLGPPGEVGSWQHQVKGYQFWIQADAEGRFAIRNVRGGNYCLYAWVPGFIGSFKYHQHLTITPGKRIELGNIVYRPPRNGPTLWEIGVPDRTAAEFYIPDPNPKLINRLYARDNQDKYRQYGLWDRYTDLYPKRDLIYKVGVSNYHTDWFFAHVPRRIRNGYKATTWEIRFPLTQVSRDTTYTLQIALASASMMELQVRINNPNLRNNPIFTTGMVGRDNAVARHGIHGLYSLYSIPVPSPLLRTGENSVFLTQARGSDFVRGLMYDYLRLEGPSYSRI